MTTTPRTLILEFAAGRGFDQREYAVLGVSYEESPERLREGMDLIRKAWTQEKLAYEGKFRRFSEISVLPRPVQKPHPPMYVASAGRESFEMAAEEGYNLMFSGFSAQEECGLLPKGAALHRAAHPHFDYFLTICEALESNERPDFGRFGFLVGDADACAETLQRCADAGIPEVLLFFNFGGYAHEPTVRSMERFAQQVMPRLL